ncbi:uncharacterized protein cep295 [Heptranchias perlo]|uniref:uncharacterized protein cep295 n=1 Tax=Heptranchias perlo TaxID=212740 RepID=UPI003559D5C9
MVMSQDTRRMKRKVAKLSGLRLSPNEEALLIKEEHERRRRLRIKQVREQERSIAVQIREEVKQRRNQQLEQLANELKTEWQKAQVEKAKSLEKLYLCSLKAVGEGHRQAKENEPDLKAQSKQIAVNREKAEKRHREALRELKQQREKELEVQDRRIKTRKKALLVEKKRAITIAHLPPPPPNPIADLEVPKYPAVKMYDIDSFSVTHYHLPEPYVDREMNTKQVSARLTADEEGKRLEELQQEAEMERREQLEKARLRGSHALQMVHLIQDRERLMKELEQMQHVDLTRRRQTVAQMPPQLFEPQYRRVEVKEDRQREMEFAFEDMYAGDKKIRGDLILRLKPEPLSAPSVGTQDEDLDLSIEPEGFQKEEQHAKGDQEELEIPHFSKTKVPPLVVSSPSSASPSKAALKKLFTKIRTQRNHCTLKPEPKDVNKDMTIESGSITSEESEQRTLTKSTAKSMEEHPETQSVLVHANKQQKEVSEDTIMAGNMTLFHPKEQATRIRSEVDRKKQLHELEQQKQQQLALLWQSEQQKQNLETHLQKAQLQQQQGETQMQIRLSNNLEKQAWQEHEQIKGHLEHQQERKDNTVSEQGTWRPQAAHMDIGHPHVNAEFKHCELVSNELSPEDEHLHTIHQYQQRLIEQNRLHKKSVEEARKQLEEYQLKKGWTSVSTRARHLSGQHSVPQISYYDTSAGSELKINISRNNPEQAFHVPFAQHPGLVNRSRTLGHWPSMTVPFDHSQPAGLPCTSTSQSQANPGIPLSTENKVPVPTICLPKNSEHASIFSPRHQPLLRQTLLDSASLKTQFIPAQQHVATVENTLNQQQQITRMSDDGSSSSGGHVNVNQNPSFVYSEIKSRHDPPKSERHTMPYDVFEVNGLEISEPCIRTLDTVVPQQGLAQVRSMEMLQDQPKPIEIQPGTSKISVEKLKHSMFSTTLTKHAEARKDQEKLCAASVDIQVQQEHLKELQQQLHRQREDLVARQMLQEEFIHRQNQMKEQMQQALEKNFIEKQPRHLTLHEVTPASENVEQLSLMSSLLQTLEEFSTGSTNKILQLENEDHLEDPEPAIQINGALLPSCCYDSESIRAGSHSSESPNIEVFEREAQHWRPSKPPVTKTRLGLFGLIEQHELSAIQEVESPKSDRLSMFVNRNTSSDNCYWSEARELTSSSMDSSRCSKIEMDFSRVSTSSSQQSSSVVNSAVDSIQTGRLTWREKLKLEAGSPPGQVLPTVPSAPFTSLPSYSADVRKGVLEYPGPTLSTCSTNSKAIFPYSWSSDTYGFTAIQKTPEADEISSTTLSTGSLASSGQVGVGPISSGDYHCTIQDIARRRPTATSPVSPVNTSSSSSSFPVCQGTIASQDIDLSSSKSEECSPNGSKIQQIIEKYTRDLNQLLDSSGKYQGSTTGHDISDPGDPNFYLPLQFSQQDSNLEFQPLESRPDFGISSSSLSSTSSKNSDALNPDNASENQHSNPAMSSEIQSFTDSIVSAPDHGRTACNINQRKEYIQQDYNVEDGGLESFQLLQLEITPSEYSLNTGHSGGSLTYVRASEQGFNNETSSTNSEYLPPPGLIRPETVGAASWTPGSVNRSTCSDLAIENLRRDDGDNSWEHSGSFFQLNATLSTVNGECHICDDQNGKQLADCEYITPRVITFTKEINSNEVDEAATLKNLANEASKSMLPEKQNCIGSEVQHVSEHNHQTQSEQLSHPKEGTAAILEREHELEAHQQDQSQFSNLASGVCRSQSTIPIWEIESDVGIMEEPELTQLTLNDSTLVDDESIDPQEQEIPVENRTTKNELNEIQAFSQASGLQPLMLKTTDHTISTLHDMPVANHKVNDKESSSQKSPTVLVFEFESSKILNEAVLKKKHKFLTNSAKRVEDMKRKERSGVVRSVELKMKPRVEPIPLKQDQTSLSASSAAAQLKMVGEVKVSTPEDRKNVEVEMRQRTLRLYSQLGEVKNRKKEVTRQAVCARNREKAKEFQKKTLEKLRAKKVHQ